MTLWARVHRLPATLLTTALSIAVAVASTGVTVPIPTLTAARTVTVPLAVFVPVVLTAVLVHALTSGPAHLELIAVRRTDRYDLAMVGGTLAAIGGTGWLIAVVSAEPMGLMWARNTIGYTGMALLLLDWTGRHAAAIVPAAFACVSALFGHAAAGRPHPWAWPLHRPSSILAALAAFILLGSGLVAFAFRGRRRRRAALTDDGGA